MSNVDTSPAVAPQPLNLAGNRVHARVVPACVIPLLLRDIRMDARWIKPLELLSWSGPALTEAKRQNIRKIVVQRLGSKRAIAWALPCGVALPEDWQSRMSTADRKRFEQLFRCDKGPLEQMTLRQVADGLNLSLPDALGRLAELEAINWVAPALTEQEQDLPKQPQTHPLRQGSMDGSGAAWEGLAPVQ